MHTDVDIIRLNEFSDFPPLKYLIHGVSMCKWPDKLWFLSQGGNKKKSFRFPYFIVTIQMLLV